MGREDSLRGRVRPGLGQTPFRGTAALRDSGGNPLGPGRLGQVRLVGMAAPPAVRPVTAKALRGPQEALEAARVKLEKAQVTAQQITRTFDSLSGLIGHDAAASAAEQAADALEDAADEYKEAERNASNG